MMKRAMLPIHVMIIFLLGLSVLGISYYSFVKSQHDMSQKINTMLKNLKLSEFNEERNKHELITSATTVANAPAVVSIGKSVYITP